MGYQLGVDLGTTYTAAAAHQEGSTRIIELGNRTATIPSVVFLTDDGVVLTGEAANRRAVTEPGRVAREFKRRIGDPAPMLVGGTPYSAESLSAQLLRWVIQHVTDAEGAAPDRVAVTHPANWGPYKLDLLHQAFRMADLEGVVTLTEPEAAAIHYATLERIDAGMHVAVFDLGGGTFDAAVLRKTEEGFDFLGQPEGIERLGGIDFDEAIFAFVTRALGPAFEQLDGSDPATVAAVGRLRRECVEVKEALSSDTEATVPVVLPTVQTDVRITRSEFEQMIRPSLADSISSMNRAVRGAGLEMEQIDLILLVGGSSRIPLVGQMVGGELGRPVAIDAHPKHSVCLGAALAAAANSAQPASETNGSSQAGDTPIEAETTAEVAEPKDLPTASRALDADDPEQPRADRVEPELSSSPVPSVGPDELQRSRPEAPEVAPGKNSGGRNKLIAGVGVAAVAVIGAVVALTGGGDTPTVDLDAGSATTEAEIAPSATTADEGVESTTTVVAVTTTTTTTEAPFVCEGLCAHIEGFTVDGDELVIDWTAHNFTPDVSNFHVHFFYNVYAPEQAGTNASFYGTTPGSWQLTDQQPFSTAGSAVSVAGAPGDATAVCVVVTDSGHGVVNPENFECLDIPAGLRG